MSQYQLFNTSEYPQSTIVFVESTFPDGQQFAGSGVMIGRNDVLTAANVVYSIEHGGAATKVLITPGYDPDSFFNSNPYGSVYASHIHYYTNFDPDGDGLIIPGNNGAGLAGSELDIGFLDLAQPLGDRTGWMGLDPSFISGYLNISGYPGTYGNRLMNDYNLTTSDPVDFIFNLQRFEIHPGNSGSPLWHDADPSDVINPMVTGVVSTALAAADIAGVYDQIIQWMTANDALIPPPTPTPTGHAVYRFYNTQGGFHFYTDSLAERDQVIRTLPAYQYEDIAFSSAGTDAAASDVYRFYNNITGAHFYTISSTERDQIIARLPQFKYEGVAYRAYTEDNGPEIPLFRFYNSASGAHFYTTAVNERDAVISGQLGGGRFHYEGIAYYVLPADTDTIGFQVTDSSMTPSPELTLLGMAASTDHAFS